MPPGLAFRAVDVEDLLVRVKNGAGPKLGAVAREVAALADEGRLGEDEKGGVLVSALLAWLTGAGARLAGCTGAETKGVAEEGHWGKEAEPVTPAAAATEEGRRGDDAKPMTPAAVAAEGPQGIEDRRLLRSRYLAIKSQIHDDKDEIASADSVKFQSVFSQVETLHQHVQKPREQVADAETFLDITSSLAASIRSQTALGIIPGHLQL